jgi:hypothetical protein
VAEPTAPDSASRTLARRDTETVDPESLPTKLRSSESEALSLRSSAPAELKQRGFPSPIRNATLFIAHIHVRR